jgi:hypothetical protein
VKILDFLNNIPIDVQVSFERLTDISCLAITMRKYFDGNIYKLSYNMPFYTLEILDVESLVEAKLSSMLKELETIERDRVRGFVKK